MSGAPAAGSPAAGRAADIAALQAALSAEHAAIFGYGVAGGHLAGARLARAQRDWAQHQADRDALAAMLIDRGASPATAAAEYQIPFPVRDARAAIALAARLEDQVAAAYLALVATSEPALRDFGARQVRAAALRASAWTGASVAFPGMSAPSLTRRGTT